MTTAKGPNGADAYTRESVEAYLRAVEAERVRIEAAIAVAGARTERATAERQRLESADGGSTSTGAETGPTTTGAEGAPTTNGRSPGSGAVGAMDTEPGGIPAALGDSLDEALWLPSETAATVARD
jgi:hypothetical protein